MNLVSHDTIHIDEQKKFATGPDVKGIIGTGSGCSLFAARGGVALGQPGRELFVFTARAVDVNLRSETRRQLGLRGSVGPRRFVCVARTSKPPLSRSTTGEPCGVDIATLSLSGADRVRSYALAPPRPERTRGPLAQSEGDKRQAVAERLSGGFEHQRSRTKGKKEDHG